MSNLEDNKLDQRGKQNSLYFLWVENLATGSGYNKDAMHDILRDKFLGYRTIQTKDKSIKTLRSVIELDKEQMKDYLIAIDMFAIEHGFKLPRPEDLYDDAMGYKKKIE